MVEVTLWNLRNEGGWFHLAAHIDEEGRLVLAGQDLGPVVESVWGDGDYEYRIVLTPERKERVLTALVRDHFSDPDDLRGWLDGLGVPHRPHQDGPPGWERLSRSGAGRRVLVPDETRDRVLLSLLHRLHRTGVFSLGRTFRSWLKEKRIPHDFSSYA